MVMLRRALRTGISHMLSSFPGDPKAQPSSPAHTDTHRPHLPLWGQGCLIYLKEAHRWQLGKGVLLPFDPRLSLKKTGCQDVPALKMQAAAAAGAKMFKLTCQPSDNFHRIDRRWQKCGNDTIICPISHGAVGQQLGQLLPAGVAPPAPLRCQSPSVPGVCWEAPVTLLDFTQLEMSAPSENQQFCCCSEKQGWRDLTSVT